jgi:predicted esterase YcpF (UPF0227 family)
MSGLPAASPLIVYLHGFNSSPASAKARHLQQVLAGRGLAAHCACPALPDLPLDAVAAVEAVLAAHRGPVCFVGSSLGGFYATHFAEKHDARAVLVNPAIDPHQGLRAYLGEQQNLHTGERYTLTERHLEQWAALDAKRINAERYLVLLETGDEVLDYRDAMVRYAGARQVVVEGGDHTLLSFPEHVPRILAFAGLPAHG